MKRFLLMVILALSFGQISIFSQWVVTSPPFSMQGDIRKLLANGTTVFAASQIDFGANGVSYTTDGGTNWNDISAGFSNHGVQALAFNDTILQAGVYGSGVFRTADNGATWSGLNIGLTNNLIRGLYFDDSLVIAGTIGGVFVSADGGDNWTLSNDGLTDFTYPNSFVRIGNVILLGAGTGVFRSTNNGASWSLASTGMGINSQVGDFAVIGTDVFVSANNISNGSVFRSTDAGLTWASAGTGLPSQYTISITASGSSLFVATMNKVLQSTDFGASWTDISTGLPDLVIGALTNSDTDLYVGLSFGGAGQVWRRSLSEVTSVINSDPGTVPSEVSLSQNYPNPFNPSTNIKFQVSNPSHVLLRVFDVLGKEVATLVNEELNGGSFEVMFNAAGLSSGIYFYTLSSGSFSDTKKLMLLR